MIPISAPGAMHQGGVKRAAMVIASCATSVAAVAMVTFIKALSARSYATCGCLLETKNSYSGDGTMNVVLRTPLTELWYLEHQAYLRYWMPTCKSDSLPDGTRRERAIMKGEVFQGCSFANAKLAVTEFTDCDLSGADLSGANLDGAYFHNCDLRGVKLSHLPMSAVLTGSLINFEDLPLNGLDIPYIPDIHQAVYAAVTAEGCVLDMSTWHMCESSHCRAGWVNTIAFGENRLMAEDRVPTPHLALAVYLKAHPTMPVPSWYAMDSWAMADIEKLAGMDNGVVDGGDHAQ